MKKFIAFMGLGIAGGIAYKIGEFLWDEVIEAKIYKMKHSHNKKNNTKIIRFKKKRS